jgi:hypothetical protein
MKLSVLLCSIMMLITLQYRMIDASDKSYCLNNAIGKVDTFILDHFLLGTDKKCLLDYFNDMVFFGEKENTFPRYFNKTPEAEASLIEKETEVFLTDGNTLIPLLLPTGVKPHTICIANAKEFIENFIAPLVKNKLDSPIAFQSLNKSNIAVHQALEKNNIVLDHCTYIKKNTSTDWNLVSLFFNIQSVREVLMKKGIILTMKKGIILNNQKTMPVFNKEYASTTDQKPLSVRKRSYSDIRKEFERQYSTEEEYDSSEEDYEDDLLRQANLNYYIN